jgi:hypothetical protein
MAAIGLLNNNQVQLHKGTNIMVGGIVVQLVAMVVFSGLAIDYWWVPFIPVSSIGILTSRW